MKNTTLCYIQKNDSYLMIHRTKKKNDYNKDKWIGVGGKIEEGESPKECIFREVKEETGLILKSAEYRGIVTFVSDENGEFYHEFMHLFWTDDFCFPEKASEKNLPECDEGELEWIPISKMNELPHWKGDEIFLDLIAKKVPFFSLKLVYKNGDLINYKIE